MASADDSFAAELAAAAAQARNHCGRYVLLQVVGEGGSARVYRAWDPQAEQQVALKMIREPDASTRARFAREVAVTRALVHPGIVPLLDSGEDGDRLFLVFELVDGVSLADHTRRRLAEDLVQTVRWVHEAALAVAAAHAQGILHRDLKPHNIVVGADGSARVLDFGLARLLEHEGDVTRTGATVGTLAFMPPEQIGAGRAVLNVACDIYSLGATLYYTLTGQPPFEVTTRDELLACIKGRPAPPPSRFHPHVPPALDAVCQRALEKQPRDRYPSAQAFADALGAWLGDERNPIPRGRLVQAGVGAGVLFVAAVGIGVVVASAQGPAPPAPVARPETWVLGARLADLERGGPTPELAPVWGPRVEALLARYVREASRRLRAVELEEYQRVATSRAEREALGPALAARDEGRLSADATALLDQAERRLRVRALEGDALRLPSASSVIAAAQARDLGTGRWAALRWASQLLGRPDLSADGREALGECLRAQRDGLRAVAVGLALCEAQAFDEVRVARDRFGRFSAFARHVDPKLPATTVPASDASPEASRARGFVRLAAGDLGGALAAFRLAGSDGISLVGQARVLLAEGRAEEGRAAAAQALERSPERVEAWRTLGEARLAQDDPRGAAVAFRQALSLEPRCPLARVGLATALEGLGQAETARRELERAWALDPSLQPTPGEPR